VRFRPSSFMIISPRHRLRSKFPKCSFTITCQPTKQHNVTTCLLVSWTLGITYWYHRGTTDPIVVILLHSCHLRRCHKNVTVVLTNLCFHDKNVLVRRSLSYMLITLSQQIFIFLYFFSSTPKRTHVFFVV